ncbi:DUF4288 domain-containing protein [Sporosarcina sp. 6E9]|uniref:DUF4288 domain-containing protein n=1 Tax=Sporosarcina sp. 6E9 TaxID=2819235 RepID=UPI001B30A75E|nr:DUF4288 domain-containing protein [Sporosarcina sp. 6E9]
MNIYSVKLLLESTVTPNDYGTKTYEESIVLIEAERLEKVEQIIRNHYVDETYENAVGGLTTWSFVTILDIFEVNDEFEGVVNFKEVYSRFLPFDKLITAEEVIKLYSLDI